MGSKGSDLLDWTMDIATVKNGQNQPYYEIGFRKELRNCTLDTTGKEFMEGWE